MTPKSVGLIKANIDLIEKSFSDVVDFNRSEIFRVDSRYIIAFKDYDPTFIKGSYRDEYISIRDRQQYTFRLMDPDSGNYSYMQLIYILDKDGKLTDGTRISYYPYISDEPSVRNSSKSEEVSHIRFELSYSQRIEYLHPLSHLQFGSLNRLRLMVDEFPSPFAFFHLIAICFFKNSWLNNYMENGVFRENVFDSTLCRHIPALGLDQTKELSRLINIRVN